MEIDDKDVIKAIYHLEQHDKEIAEVKENIKELQEKTQLLAELSYSIKTLAENVKDVKETVMDIKSEQTNMKDEITDLKQIPSQNKAKTFDKVIIGIAAAIGGGILAYLLKVLFPTIF